MDAATIKVAEEEARRFLKRVAAWGEAVSKNPDSWGNPKEQGAVRRASLDLTRALAEMRRP